MAASRYSFATDAWRDNRFAKALMQLKQETATEVVECGGGRVWPRDEIPAPWSALVAALDSTGTNIGDENNEPAFVAHRLLSRMDLAGQVPALVHLLTHATSVIQGGRLISVTRVVLLSPHAQRNLATFLTMQHNVGTVNSEVLLPLLAAWVRADSQGLADATAGQLIWVLLSSLPPSARTMLQVLLDAPGSDDCSQFPRGEKRRQRDEASEVRRLLVSEEPIPRQTQLKTIFLPKPLSTVVFKPPNPIAAAESYTSEVPILDAPLLVADDVPVVLQPPRSAKVLPPLAKSVKSLRALLQASPITPVLLSSELLVPALPSALEALDMCLRNVQETPTDTLPAVWMALDLPSLSDANERTIMLTSLLARQGQDISFGLCKSALKHLLVPVVAGLTKSAPRDLLGLVIHFARQHPDAMLHGFCEPLIETQAYASPHCEMLTRMAKECFTASLRIRCLAALLQRAQDARTWGEWHVKLATNVIKAGLELDSRLPAHVELSRTLVGVLRAGVGLSALDTTAQPAAKATRLQLAALLVAFLTNCSECATLHLAALDPVVLLIPCRDHALHSLLSTCAAGSEAGRPTAANSCQSNRKTQTQMIIAPKNFLHILWSTMVTVAENKMMRSPIPFDLQAFSCSLLLHFGPSTHRTELDLTPLQRPPPPTLLYPIV
jgi:hypothetical protein